LSQPLPQLVPATSYLEKGGGPLHGARLRLLQALWLVLVLIDLATLAVSLPFYVQSLFTVCSGPLSDCPDTGQLDAGTLRVLLHAGFSLRTYALYVLILDLLTTLPFLAVGAVIAWRRANTSVGLFVSFLLITIGCLGPSFAHSDAIPGTSPNSFIGIVGIASFLPTLLYYPSLSFFFSTFPDGRFVPRWSWALIFLWILNAFVWITPVPSLNLGSWPPLLEAGWISLVFGGSACVQLYRFLRVASPLQRQQIKWLLYGFVPVIVLPLCLTLYMTFVPTLNQPGAFLLNTPHSLLLVVALPLYRLWYLPVPFCVGIALLRYRLWDIDVIINRTLVYGSLTATLLLVYLVLVFGGQHLLASLLGPNNVLVVVASTLIVFALSQPLRRRVQRLVDLRFYRSKYDAGQLVARFGETLRQEVNLDQLREDLLAVIQEAVQPTQLSLWLRPRRPGESPDPPA
jgi:hypothetical protein